MITNSIVNKTVEERIDTECLIISEGNITPSKQVTLFNEFQFESKKPLAKHFVEAECLIISEGFNPIQIINEMKAININSTSDISVFTSCFIDSIDTSIVDDPFMMISQSNDLFASIIINSIEIPNNVIKNIHCKSYSARKNIRNSDNIVRYSSINTYDLNIMSIDYLPAFKSIKNKNARSVPNKKENIISQINEGYDDIQLIHSSKSESFFLNNAEIFIMSEHSLIPVLTDWINYPSITILSEDSRPPSGLSGSSTGGGEGMKNFRLIVQKNAYMEYALEFNNKVISSITGLPSGMIFDKSYLKGSPNVSGRYNISIKFIDNTSIPGTIIVTQIHRKL